MNQLNILYKRDTVGKIQQWTIFYEGDHFWTESGEFGGKLTKSASTVCESKNVGKANATTPEAQAKKEAKAKWDDKIKKGYTPDINNVDTAKKFGVMLAEDYGDHKSELEFPVFVQPKLDGVRATIDRDGLVWSRQNNQFFTFPHIVREVFPKILAKLPAGVRLDGEGYTHTYKDDFNAIIKLVKRLKPTEEDLANAQKYLQYWCYDITHPEWTFSKRSQWIAENLSGLKYITVVPTFTCNSLAEIHTYHKEFRRLGYEGTIIRKDDYYQSKRTWSLLKFKDWITEEFPIVDILPGKGGKATMAAKAIVRLKDGTTCDTGINGSDEFCTELLRNKDKVIGEPGTIEYQNMTPDGKLRFPRMIAVRNYE